MRWNIIEWESSSPNLLLDSSNEMLQTTSSRCSCTETVQNKLNFEVTLGSTRALTSAVSPLTLDAPFVWQNPSVVDSRLKRGEGLGGRHSAMPAIPLWNSRRDSPRGSSSSSSGSEMIEASLRTNLPQVEGNSSSSVPNKLGQGDTHLD